MAVEREPGRRQFLQRADGPQVILASASATRARLLADAGVRAQVRPAAVDEQAIKEAAQAAGASPGDAAIALAELKARRGAASQPPGSIVLGADQILTCEGRWFDKPERRAAAMAQLQALSGRRHELWTAVVACRDGARIWHHLSAPRLWLRPCSDTFLENYLDAAGDDVLQSVGAYRIEGLGAQLFTRVEGDQFAIQGLPLLELLEFLRVQGVLPR